MQGRKGDVSPLYPLMLFHSSALYHAKKIAFHFQHHTQ